MTTPDDLDALAREYAKKMDDYHDSDGVDVSECFKAGWTARGEPDELHEFKYVRELQKQVTQLEGRLDLARKTASDFQARYSGALDRLAKLERVADAAREVTNECCTGCRLSDALQALDQDSAKKKRKRSK